MPQNTVYKLVRQLAAKGSRPGAPCPSAGEDSCPSSEREGKLALPPPFCSVWALSRLPTHPGEDESSLLSLFI